MENKSRFAFGKNWSDFVNNKLDDKRIEEAKKSIIKMIKLEDLSQYTFLDIGCGSGIFSLAANLLNAKYVYSFDYDGEAVKTTKQLRDIYNISESDWKISEGDILNEEWLSGIPNADIVYSWGVLHHTGSMWKAIENAITKVNPNGYLAISIYNHVNTPRDSSKMWWRIKKFYNNAPKLIKKMMVYLFIIKIFLSHLKNGRNPIKEIKRYGERGMDFYHDAKDWVGGFPYEYAYAEEVIHFLKNFKTYELIYLNQKTGNACNEFTFRHYSNG